MTPSTLNVIKQKREDYKADARMFKQLWLDYRQSYDLQEFYNSIANARHCNKMLFKKAGK